jgi:hypothetical protein
VNRVVIAALFVLGGSARFVLAADQVPPSLMPTMSSPSSCADGDSLCLATKVTRPVARTGPGGIANAVRPNNLMERKNGSSR